MEAAVVDSAVAEGLEDETEEGVVRRPANVGPSPVAALAIRRFRRVLRWVPDIVEGVGPGDGPDKRSAHDETAPGRIRVGPGDEKGPDKFIIDVHWRTREASDVASEKFAFKERRKDIDIVLGPDVMCGIELCKVRHRKYLLRCHVVGTVGIGYSNNVAVVIVLNGTADKECRRDLSGLAPRRPDPHSAPNVRSSRWHRHEHPNSLISQILGTAPSHNEPTHRPRLVLFFE